MCGSGAEGGRAEPCSAPLRGGGAIWLKGMVYPFKRLYNIPGPVAGARMAAWLRPPSPLPPPTPPAPSGAPGHRGPAGAG